MVAALAYPKICKVTGGDKQSCSVIDNRVNRPSEIRGSFVARESLPDYLSYFVAVPQTNNSVDAVSFIE
jgi:hypothetical protein